MAKTLRKPVDKFERNQRLAERAERIEPTNGRFSQRYWLDQTNDEDTDLTAEESQLADAILS